MGLALFRAGPEGSRPAALGRTSCRRASRYAWRGALLDQVATLKVRAVRRSQSDGHGPAIGPALGDKSHDLDGWLRLIRAYSVLGDKPKARRRAHRAKDVFATEAPAQAALAKAAQEQCSELNPRPEAAERKNAAKAGKRKTAAKRPPFAKIKCKVRSAARDAPCHTGQQDVFLRPWRPGRASSAPLRRSSLRRSRHNRLFPTPNVELVGAFGEEIHLPIRSEIAGRSNPCRGEKNSPKRGQDASYDHRSCSSVG